MFKKIFISIFVLVFSFTLIGSLGNLSVEASVGINQIPSFDSDIVSINNFTPLETPKFNTPSFRAQEEDNILALILNFILGVILLVLAVIANIILFLVVWLLEIIVVLFSSFLVSDYLNPATGNLWNAAQSPWTIFLSIANIMLLASIFWVGFGYILNIEQLKVKVNDFIVKIVTVALLTNFSLSLTATFINFGKSIGDLLLLLGPGDGEGPVKLKNLILNSLNAVRGRGNFYNIAIEGGSKLADPKGLFEFSASTFIRDALLIGVVGLIAWIFSLKLLRLVLSRLIYLFGLMITSPIALVGLTSPVPQFQKFGREWLAKLISMTFFYPQFILILLVLNQLVNALAESVGSITDQDPNAFSLATNSDEAFWASFAETFNSSISNIVPNIIPILVLAVGFSLLGDLLDKTLSEFDGNLLSKNFDRAKEGFKNLSNMTKAAGNAGRIISKGAKAVPNLQLKSFNNKLKSKQEDIDAIDNQLKGEGLSDLDRRNLMDKKTKLEDDKQLIESEKNQKIEEINKNWGWLDKTGDVLQAAGYAPELAVEGAANLGKNLFNGIVAQSKTRAYSNIEMALRGVPGMGALADNMNLRTFEGLNANDLDAIKQDRGADHFVKEINQRSRQSYLDTTGRKQTFSKEYLPALLQKYKNLSPSALENGREFTKFQALTKQALQDDTLRGQMLANKNLTGMIKSNFSQLNDNETYELIDTYAPHLNPNSGAVAGGARRAVSDVFYRNRLSSATFNDSDFQKEFIATMGEDRRAEALQIINEKAGTNRGVLGFDIDESSSVHIQKNDRLKGDSKRIAQTGITSFAGKGIQDVIYKNKVAEIENTITSIENSNLTQNEKRIQIETQKQNIKNAEKELYNKNFGIEADFDQIKDLGASSLIIPGETANQTISRLENTTVGQSVISSNKDAYNKLSQSEKAEVLKSTVLTAFEAHKKSQETYKNNLGSIVDEIKISKFNFKEQTKTVNPALDTISYAINSRDRSFIEKNISKIAAAKANVNANDDIQNGRVKGSENLNSDDRSDLNLRMQELYNQAASSRSSEVIFDKEAFQKEFKNQLKQARDAKDILKATKLEGFEKTINQQIKSNPNSSPEDIIQSFKKEGYGDNFINDISTLIESNKKVKIEKVNYDKLVEGLRKRGGNNKSVENFINSEEFKQWAVNTVESANNSMEALVKNAKNDYDLFNSVKRIEAELNNYSNNMKKRTSDNISKIEPDDINILLGGQ